MTEPGPQLSPDEEAQRQRRQRWNSLCIGVAGVCLAGLMFGEALGLTEPWFRGLMMIGVAIGGTGAIIVHARRKCPNCGEPYGYHLRLVNMNTCRHCGAEFPTET